MPNSTPVSLKKKVVGPKSFFQVKNALKNVGKNDYDAPEAVRPWRKWKKYLKQNWKNYFEKMHPFTNCCPNPK